MQRILYRLRRRETWSQRSGLNDIIGQPGREPFPEDLSAIELALSCVTVAVMTQRRKRILWTSLAILVVLVAVGGAHSSTPRSAERIAIHPGSGTASGG